MLPSVDIVQTSGNSGKKSSSYDSWSGLIFYGTAPVVSGKWQQYPGPPIINAQQMLSVDDATSAGIIPYTDNTAPTATYLITTKGNTGDTLNIKCTIPKPNSTTLVVDLGTYTVGAGDTTIALQGAAIAAIINAGTPTHGFTASFTTATLTITAPKTVGVSLNSGTPYAVTVSATFAGTLTQNVVAGTVSYYSLWYYHISEYFRLFPEGTLWVGIISASSSFVETQTLQTASGSQLRQIGIFDNSSSRGSAANITGTITQLGAAVRLKQKTAPFYAIYSPNISGVADLSTLTDQNFNTSKEVQTVISQDGAASGALLYVTSGMTVGHVGVKLATRAKARCSASDAQPDSILFNISDGVENDTVSFGNGQLLSVVSDNLVSQLDSFRYTFVRKFGSTVVGSYWTGNKSCIDNRSQYANSNDMMTYNKISRILYSSLIPQLNSELIFNEDGTLRSYTIDYFQDLCEDSVTAEMITGFGALPLISGIKVVIDAAQKVKQTENFQIQASYIQNGIARKITVDLGPVDSF